jgi:hypothetical protein
MANRRVQGGGNPAQGPLRDAIRSVPLAGESESFPDVPPGNRSDIPTGGRAHLHTVDLDSFAERLGLHTEGARADSDHDESRTGRLSGAGRRTSSLALGTAGLMAHGAAHGLAIASRKLDRLGDHLDRR